MYSIDYTITGSLHDLHVYKVKKQTMMDIILQKTLIFITTESQNKHISIFHNFTKGKNVIFAIPKRRTKGSGALNGRLD